MEKEWREEAQDLLNELDPLRPGVTVEQALVIAQKYFIWGRKFQEIDTDRIRTMTPWRDESEPIFDIVRYSNNANLGVRCLSGCGDEQGCSNPFVWEDGVWVKIID